MTDENKDLCEAALEAAVTELLTSGTDIVYRPKPGNVLVLRYTDERGLHYDEIPMEKVYK